MGVKMKKKYFIGKRALEAELDRGSEWEFVGIDIQWTELEAIIARLVLHRTSWRSLENQYPL
ncbi:MAG: hypothetical protein CM1200mP10_16600 [Candidatus Neomarinimicrobiota bacterium]|nr:MAG: hypothetical protein CM1200mP10_16600 [Candidatus Neomarinimicrobiota bacterium]